MIVNNGEQIPELATKLSELTDMKWRARDVEMAAFTAWGDRDDDHPRFVLNPI